MKRVIIIHGWGSSPHNDWLPWIKKELESKGYEVIMPVMPDSENPKIGTWVPYLREVVGDINESDVFIGHSIGCQTILRFLETVSENQKGDKVILVAPWIKLLLESDEDWEIAKPWIETPIDFEKIKSRAHSFYTIFSDNDPFVPLEENRKIFKNGLGAEVILQENMGHFSEEDGIIKLPILLELI